MQLTSKRTKQPPALCFGDRARWRRSRDRREGASEASRRPTITHHSLFPGVLSSSSKGLVVGSNQDGTDAVARAPLMM